MAEWLSGVDPRDVVRIEIVRVTVEGRPSAVTKAYFAVHLRDGRTGETSLPFPGGVMYEVVEDLVRDANRAFGR